VVPRRRDWRGHFIPQASPLPAHLVQSRSSGALAESTAIVMEARHPPSLPFWVPPSCRTKIGLLNAKMKWRGDGVDVMGPVNFT